MLCSVSTFWNVQYCEIAPRAQVIRKGSEPMKVDKKRTSRAAVLAVAALCVVLYGFMYAQSRVVNVEYADVYVKDLPDAFEGTKLLFLSDIHISGASDVQRTRDLMAQLQALKPDLLLLGGDYSDLRAWNRLRCLGNKQKIDALEQQSIGYSHQWMESLADFQAPLGKFAVQGNHDVKDMFLSQSLALGGVRLLMNEAVAVEKGGATLTLAGLGDYTEGDFQLQSVVQQVKQGDCVVLLSHNPDALPLISTTDVAGGGAWADLTLCGHTHGGQIRLGKWAPITNSDYGDRYLTGWHEEIGGFALTSNGVGTSLLPIRFNAPAQAHLITLHVSRPQS